ncbi:hypothetical protein ACYSNO_11500 [Enterococcus sp. LJL98]
MKKIAFVLYTYQLLSVMYVNGLPTTKPLEKALKQALGKTYEVTFHWEAAAKEQTVDAFIVPDRFPPILNEHQIPEIRLPSILFLTKEVDQIKTMIDTYFSEREQ